MWAGLVGRGCAPQNTYQYTLSCPEYFVFFLENMRSSLWMPFSATLVPTLVFFSGVPGDKKEKLWTKIVSSA